MTCDENVVDDGLADIYVYYAFMSCDERSVCRYWIWPPCSSWMRGQFVTSYSRLKMSLTTIQNKTKSRRHKIHITYIWHFCVVKKTYLRLSSHVPFMTFRTLGDALTDQCVIVTVVIKYNNMWRKDTTVTKGHNILWRFSILSSQGTLCDGHYMTTGMTLLFCHKTLFMTNFVLTMTVCLCHINQCFL